MAIRNMLHEMAGNETKTPLLVLAPMGVAAFNIRGRTVNSALSKPICNSNNNLDINGGRLKTITAKHNNEPFGGRSIILFGDFGQLPPVLDLPMNDGIQGDALSNDGFAAYKQFREVYKLEAIQRQFGDSAEQKFREILSRMRDGESTIED
ncbi:hypothetical protein RhiirA5_433777 [Rhizophagus irregularis]|uniref:ATP-dependent DNA helicase n=1 Tax=Rhizophagus irregularis TaxID=588596 RepID=A0A2N0NR72_9GLOM|nr:hypothetical protein RhiirA5_433777 [Rhizophagus irregularis]GET49957.1 ATP-dependent DNA helicase PIF1-like [Rhizophagus irregularis DAOM 181602=DAOM 197198]